MADATGRSGVPTMVEQDRRGVERGDQQPGPD
jgi:hypothetical protein